MSQRQNDGIFDEFEFMYRHKRELEDEKKRLEEEEQRIREKEAAEAAEKAAAAALLSEQKQDVKHKPEKKAKQKKQKKKPAAVPAQKDKKEKKKIHPKYAKPYRNDTEKDRARIKTDKHRKIEKKYKKEKELTEKERKNRAEIKAAAKVFASRALIYTLCALILALILSLAIYGILRIAVGFRRGTPHKNISYQVGLSADTVRVPYDTLVRDGVVYVCGDDVVKLCGFTVTGTESELKYISPDKGNDTALFYTGTNRVSVNKNDVRLIAETFYEDGRLYIPMSFFSSYSTGLVCEFKPETEDARAEIRVYKRILNEYDHKISGLPAQYEPVTFRLKEQTVLQPLDESVLADEIPEPEYKIDASDYLDSINPHNLYGYISVVNESHRATGTMMYDDLTQIVIQSPSVKEPIMLRRDAARALEAMFLEVRGVEGYERFNVYSGYRTYEESTEKDPSLDENLLGLSVDAYFGDKDRSYADTNTYKWFYNNAYKYGFIIRYPSGKSDITGVGFRPWTLRFVGRYAATKMHDEGLCLEEFIEKYNLERVLEIKKGDQ